MFEFRRALALGLLAAACSTLTSGGACAGYRVINLGVAPGTTGTQARAINNSGVIAGYTTGLERAFRYIGGRGIELLPTLGGGVGRAYGLNDSGDVAGYSYLEDNSIRAFRWAEHSGIENLGTFPVGGGSSQATAINASGQVAGFALLNGSQRAFRYSNGVIQDLGVLPGAAEGAVSVANALNDLGEVVGDASTTDLLIKEAFRTDPNGQNMTGLGTLGGAQSWATAVNNSGQITGYAKTSLGETHAYRREAAGSLRDLRTLGGTRSYGYSINSDGYVVGYSTTPGDTSQHAFIWRNTLEGMTDLNSMLPPDSGWILESAYGINDSGQITGVGRYKGSPAAFLLTSDDTAPSIVNTTASPGLAAPGQIVSLAVTATDDVGVTSALADDIPLQKDPIDGVWKGNLTAEPSPGKHAFHVVAYDASGNSASQDVSYTTAHRVVANNRALTHPLIATVRDAFVFTARGRVVSVDPVLKLWDGSEVFGEPTLISIFGAAGSFQIGDYISVTGIVTALGSNPAIATTPDQVIKHN